MAQKKIVESEHELEVTEIDMDKLSKETEIALADYNVGDPIKAAPLERTPFIQLREKGEKMAGKLLAIREDITKYHKVGYDFELIPSEKHVTLLGTDVFNKLAKEKGVDGKPLVQIGKSYCIVSKGKIAGKGNPYYDYDIMPITA